ADFDRAVNLRADNARNEARGGQGQRRFAGTCAASHRGDRSGGHAQINLAQRLLAAARVADPEPGDGQTVGHLPRIPLSEMNTTPTAASTIAQRSNRSPRGSGTMR